MLKNQRLIARQLASLQQCSLVVVACIEESKKSFSIDIVALVYYTTHSKTVLKVVLPLLLIASLGEFFNVRALLFYLSAKNQNSNSSATVLSNGGFFSDKFFSFRHSRDATSI